MTRKAPSISGSGASGPASTRVAIPPSSDADQDCIRCGEPVAVSATQSTGRGDPPSLPDTSNQEEEEEEEEEEVEEEGEQEREQEQEKQEKENENKGSPSLDRS